MARALTLANGSLLVGIDTRGCVRDLYYPYVGLENNISSGGGTFQHRVGVWVSGTLSWLSDPAWQIDITASTEVLMGTVRAHNASLGITLILEDMVLHDKDVFVRNVTVESDRDEGREIRIFFAQQFRISEDRSGSTGFFDPRVHAIVHYKGPLFFLVGGMQEQYTYFDDYSIGLFNMESREGTHIDAEDGALSKNPIEHGSVDSVIRFTAHVSKKSPGKVIYWIAAGTTLNDVHTLHVSLKANRIDRALKRTKEHWKRWTARASVRELDILDDELKELYLHSLLVVQAHADKGGGIIASSDTDILNYGRDTYSYVWPRDAAYAAHALDVAGYHETAERFFRYASKLLEREGYLMHKYRPDGALGSSWHPWIWKGKPELPIQEDETATVLFMLYKHYELTKDDELISRLYEGTIAPMSEFLLRYRDTTLGLPLESYDLWEETYGISPYTASTVYGGLMAAALFAQKRRNQADANRYFEAAETLKKAILAHLFDHDRGYFLKYVRRGEEGLEKNYTIDISGLHGLWYFGVLTPHASELVSMHSAVEANLKVKTGIGGYVRYEGDNYYRLSPHDPSNPWIVTTLFVARYRIAAAQSLDELHEVLGMLMWVKDRVHRTNMLSEQYNPHNGEPLSVTPLVWSHAAFIMAVREYAEMYKKLS